MTQKIFRQHLYHGAPATLGTYNLSFFVHNEKETKKLVEELFTEQNGTEEETNTEANNTTSNTVKNSNNNTTSNASSNTTNITKDNTTAKNVTNTTKETTVAETNNNSKIKIELLNGSGEKTVLSKVTNKLEAKGYNVYKTGTNDNVTSKTLIINRNSVSNEVTDDLKQILGVGTVQSMLGVNTVDITIIIGKDYK